MASASRDGDTVMEEIELAPHTRMQIGADRFDHPTLTFLHKYWNDKRGDRAMPSRSEIAPSELRQHLNWVFLADVLPDMADFRYRLVGGLVEQYFGTSGANMTLREVFARFGEATLKTTLYIYRKAAKAQVPVRLIGQSKWDGDKLEAFETVYLPLSDDGETTNMILSGFVFDRDTVLTNRAIEREHSPD